MGTRNGPQSWQNPSMGSENEITGSQNGARSPKNEARNFQIAAQVIKKVQGFRQFP